MFSYIVIISQRIDCWFSSSSSSSSIRRHLKANNDERRPKHSDDLLPVPLEPLFLQHICCCLSCSCSLWLTNSSIIRKWHWSVKKEREREGVKGWNRRRVLQSRMMMMTMMRRKGKLSHLRTSQFKRGSLFALLKQSFCMYVCMYVFVCVCKEINQVSSSSSKLAKVLALHYTNG